MEEQKPYLIIISGPSGAGEDSVINGLKKKLPIEPVITTVTREKRLGESQGNPYYFTTKEQFLRDVEDGKFFEHAQHYNEQYYGTSTEELERIRKTGKIGILKIDYQGVESAKKKMPGIKAIFLIAPLDVLEKRIRARQNVTDEYVAERMEYTKKWMKHRDIYDYEVVNEQGKLEDTIIKVAEIIRRECLLDKKALL